MKIMSGRRWMKAGATLEIESGGHVCANTPFLPITPLEAWAPGGASSGGPIRSGANLGPTAALNGKRVVPRVGTFMAPPEEMPYTNIDVMIDRLIRLPP